MRLKRDVSTLKYSVLRTAFKAQMTKFHHEKSILSRIGLRVVNLSENGRIGFLIVCSFILDQPIPTKYIKTPQPKRVKTMKETVNQNNAFLELSQAKMSEVDLLHLIE